MALDPPLSINRCPDFPDLIEKPSFSQNEFRHGTPTPRDGNNCRNLKLNPDLKSSANVGNAYNEVKTDGKFCSECGTSLSMTAKFCPECGSTQE